MCSRSPLSNGGVAYKHNCMDGDDLAQGILVLLAGVKRQDHSRDYELEKGKLDVELYVGATVQEEVGLRGAQTAAGLINPDVFLAVDCSPCQDTFGGDDISGSLGKGFMDTDNPDKKYKFSDGDWSTAIFFGYQIPINLKNSIGVSASYEYNMSANETSFSIDISYGFSIWFFYIFFKNFN